LNNVISTICDINNLKAVCSGVVRGGDISKAFYVETSEKRLFVKVNNIEGYAGDTVLSGQTVLETFHLT
jgi:fructosamine-3-kinase